MNLESGKMHDKIQPYELDMAWLDAECKTKGIKASTKDREDFAERCSIMWQNETIDRARKNAFFCVFVSTVD